MKIQTHQREVQREDFAGGSALVTIGDGSVLLLETKLAKPAVLREGRPVNGVPIPNLIPNRGWTKKLNTHRTPVNIEWD